MGLQLPAGQKEEKFGAWAQGGVLIAAGQHALTANSKGGRLRASERTQGGMPWQRSTRQRLWLGPCINRPMRGGL